MGVAGQMEHPNPSQMSSLKICSNLKKLITKASKTKFFPWFDCASFQAKETVTTETDGDETELIDVHEDRQLFRHKITFISSFLRE